jgi:diadenosine tetraphosphate (Ap4A) HIT family hydrolase
MWCDKATALAKLEHVMRGAPSACAMCSLVLGYPSDLQVLTENEVAVVVLDQFGSRHGHLLAIPRRHVECMIELNEPEFIALHALAWRAARAVKQVTNASRMWVASLGTQELVPMSCAHAHVHILPITESGDAARPAQVLSWSNGVYVYDAAEQLELAERIRGQLTA